MELRMTASMRTVIFPVEDLGAAKQLYGALLGVAPSVDESYYVGFDVDGQHVGLDPNGHRHVPAGPVGYWHVGDIAKAIGAMVASGAETLQSITDVGGGKLIATVKDPDGNIVGLLQEPAGPGA
jgi:predicted enzyme related to lactoylglutathione lyase